MHVRGGSLKYTKFLFVLWQPGREETVIMCIPTPTFPVLEKRLWCEFTTHQTYQRSYKDTHLNFIADRTTWDMGSIFVSLNALSELLFFSLSGAFIVKIVGLLVELS